MDSADSQVMLQPQVGEVVAGKYRLDRVLGAGGMGMVFAATHMELDRLVAVKFVHAVYCQNPEVIARFVREARAVVKIESEHVAKVIDVGHTPSGAPYMVMEHLDGEDLSDLLKMGPINVSDAVDYVVQACAAMLEAHEMGIVHRDLKPANLFLTHRRDRSPLIKVLDFGISKLNDADSSQAALTNPSMLMGSPAYMSPEQLINPREVDPRTDLWSLGVILFELLAGRPAFQAQSLPLLMTAIMQQEPDDILSLRPDVPPGLAAVIRRSLAKRVEERFQSVPEMVNALLPFAPRRSHWSIERIAKSAGSNTLTGNMDGTGPTISISSMHSLSGAKVRASTALKDATDGVWSGKLQTTAVPPGGMRWLWPLLGAAVVIVGGAVVWLMNAKENPQEQPGSVANTPSGIAMSETASPNASHHGVPLNTGVLTPGAFSPGGAAVTSVVPVPAAAMGQTSTLEHVPGPSLSVEAIAPSAPASPGRPVRQRPNRPTGGDSPARPSTPERNPLQMDLK
jgi:eukaryotic-like serine/threonine-protein kinase